MLAIKPGVDIFGMRPELLLGIFIAERIWAAFGVELVLTSVRDGKHSETSLHYAGCAADFRTNGIDPDILKEIVRQLKEKLGRDFDVIVEADHIHIEYQPRRPV